MFRSQVPGFKKGAGPSVFEIGPSRPQRDPALSKLRADYRELIKERDILTIACEARQNQIAALKALYADPLGTMSKARGKLDDVVTVGAGLIREAHGW
jgi:hypothetical protein